MSALTKAQAEVVKSAARRGATFYCEMSMSGFSETLRAKYPPSLDPYGNIFQPHSELVFSVLIHEYQGGDDPQDIAKFHAKCQEAESLRKEILEEGRIA